MSIVTVECPECGCEAELDEDLLGSRIVCSDCAQPFVADAGGAHDCHHLPGGDIQVQITQHDEDAAADGVRLGDTVSADDGHSYRSACAGSRRAAWRDG